jgi:hypothetical protein
MEELSTEGEIKEMEENGNKRNEDGTFKVGFIPNPNGRPKESEELKAKRKALKAIIKEYKEELAQALPSISSILKEKAIAGDIQFIKELHDRVMGKPEQKSDITSDGEKINPIPIINVYTDNSNKQNTQDAEENPNSAGGNECIKDSEHNNILDSISTV